MEAGLRTITRYVPAQRSMGICSELDCNRSIFFNELVPPSTESDYLKNNTQSVIKSLKDNDPDAVWVMQGWLFVDKKSWDASSRRALLESAGKDDIVNDSRFFIITNVANGLWHSLSWILHPRRSRFGRSRIITIIIIGYGAM